MIQKLRRKFVATNMFLVSLVLLAVFFIQTYSAYRHARERVYQAQLMALRWIVQELPPGFAFDMPRRGGERGREENREDSFPSVPIFAVEIDADGRIIALQEGPGATVTQETAQELTDAALAQTREQGMLPGQSLSYLYRQENGREFLAFADNHVVAVTLRAQLLTSAGICALALTVFYLISRFLAKLSLRPVERAWEQQRQFVADASHELKTPITVILANTGIVLAHPSDTVEQQAKWIEYTQDEASRMKALVDDLLFLAKSDAAKLPLQPAQVPLSELVTGAILPFESVFFESGVALEETVAPGLTVWGDEGQLRRLVMILLDNAVKYAGEQGRVIVRLDETQGKPRLTVNNSGPAIPPEHLPHLFERFYRSDAARDRAQGGYGLGLAIAKSIVETQGGRISVTSTPEVGTTFTVVFSKK